jgi:hypothetical protein
LPQHSHHVQGPLTRGVQGLFAFGRNFDHRLGSRRDNSNADWSSYA